jgi:citrate synthase
LNQYCNAINVDLAFSSQLMAEHPMNRNIDDFVGAKTVLSHVDGEAGRLIIRGHDLEELAGHLSFEDATGLLWSEVVALDQAGDLSIAVELGKARTSAFQRQVPLLRGVPELSQSDTMRFLLGAEPATRNRHEPLDAVAAVGVAAAISSRHCLGLPLLEPDAHSSHAADLLRLIRGDPPDSPEVIAFETYLVAALDHGLNASTFTARVVASTQAGLQASILAAFCALTGPLHGGAPGPVLDMLDAIERSGDAAQWIAHELAAGRRLMGFGHRIYRVRDPRADVLKAALKRLGKAGRLERAEQIEKEAIAALGIHKSGRRLDVNTEFYTALLLETLRIPRQCFTPVFAAARVAGWVAHIREEESVGRLIRPQSHYLGNMPMRAA